MANPDTDTPTLPHPHTSAAALNGKQIIIALCGGIAAYKVADVVSKLVQAGAGVDVVMTDAAQKFVTPLTFQALSGRPVRTSTWHLQDSSDPQHISLTERASLLLVAPATMDMLAKVGHGLCDDLVSLMIAAAACPVVFAPAMNNRMWDNPINQENVAKLKGHGYQFIGPEAGWLACRNVGEGRMSEPATIVERVSQILLSDRPAGGGVSVDNAQKSPHSGRSLNG
jgi:phosphopantothenoylcysteine decarboxylase/phosphopantothenate--cysteine ligase